MGMGDDGGEAHLKGAHLGDFLWAKGTVIDADVIEFAAEKLGMGRTGANVENGNADGCACRVGHGQVIDVCAIDVAMNHAMGCVVIPLKDKGDMVPVVDVVPRQINKSISIIIFKYQ